MSIKLVEQFKDKQTLSRLKSQDKQAFIRAYDEHVKEINRFVYFKIGSREEANDLTSMIFLKAWNHILLYKIARTSIVDYYRETGNKVTASLDDENNRVEAVLDDTLDIGDRLDQEADLELIRHQLPLLKEDYREVIIMKFVNDLSLEEMADITGKSKGNLRVLIHRSLNALRELVEKERPRADKSPDEQPQL
jgi:RNA polymerase sigma-70 factor (ECF subfamily)